MHGPLILHFCTFEWWCITPTVHISICNADSAASCSLARRPCVPTDGLDLHRIRLLFKWRLPCSLVFCNQHGAGVLLGDDYTALPVVMLSCSIEETPCCCTQNDESPVPKCFRIPHGDGDSQPSMKIQKSQKPAGAAGMRLLASWLPWCWRLRSLRSSWPPTRTEHQMHGVFFYFFLSGLRVVS